MIKKIVRVLISTMMGSFLYASSYDLSNKGFLGLEVGFAIVNGDKFGSFKHQGTGAEYGVRFGAQSNEWRATFAFDYFNSNSDDQKVEKGYLMVDYFFLKNNTDLPVKPFVGANVGMMNYESTQVSATGLIYGAQIGAVYSINENVDLDLSYRYSLATSQQVNDFGTIMFGFNYLY